MQRRRFLQNSLCAALSATSASSLLDNLGCTAAAVSAGAAQSSDYKALVCVFLFGGNDGDNMLVPYSQSEYNAYAAARSILAIPRAQLLPITPATSDGRNWSFHPSFTEMQQLFAQKKLALVSNVGPLVVPTTRDQYLRNSVPLPPLLGSHNDQQVHWQTSWPDQPPKTGWGGRMADLVNSFNSGSQLSMSISLDGSNVFQVGRQVFPYSLSPQGVIPLFYYDETKGGPETTVTKTMLNAGSGNLLEKSYGEVFKRAIDNSQRLSSVLQAAPVINTVFPAGSKLADQLRMVAKLISVRNSLGMRRQVFFCDLGGFDTHGEQTATQAELLGEVSQSLNAFYQATVELGVAANVTTFTSSDFGRTYKCNGKGTDHGWGSHQFVLGGAVRGGEIYGRIPIQRVDGPDDTTEGRWIPTIATDEYAATLALWFGVQTGDLPLVLPNINRFNRSNLDFLG